MQICYASYFPSKDTITGQAAIKRKTKWAKWLGIGSLISFIIPVVQLLSIPAAIVSLILAGQVKRQTDDPVLLKDAKTGKIFSLATLGLVVLSVILAAVILASLFSSFR